MNIGDYAFYECTGLDSITMEGVTNIGIFAFAWCTGVTGITLPITLISIGDYAFYNTSLNIISIPNNVINIGEGAFSECFILTSAIIGSGVTNIGEGAFRSCNELTSVSFIDNSYSWYVATSSTATSGTTINVSNPSLNATNLTDTYCSYYWFRSN